MTDETYLSIVERIGEKDTVTSPGGLIGLVLGDELGAVKVVLNRDDGYGCREDSGVL